MKGPKFKFKKIKKIHSDLLKNMIDKYEVNIFNNIKSQLSISKYSPMLENQRTFINLIIRKFRPKTILVLGFIKGVGSIIILNAIQDIINIYLYSIDLTKNEMIDFYAKNIFPKLYKILRLYKGNISAKF
jgi:predicted O-methyltransferase YrrM